MNYNELEGIFRGGSKDIPLNFVPRDSKACAGAMRALQEHLKELESENNELKDKIAVFENRSANDREKWQIRIMEEVQQGKDKENLLQNRLKERDEEINKWIEKFTNIEEQFKIKEGQCRHIENEIKRNREQSSVDIENLNLQIELLQKRLNEQKSEGKNSHLIIEKTEREKLLIEEELKQEKRVNQSLQSEVNFLRENSENQRISLQKNFESLEIELNKQNSEYCQKIKELEIKNKSLRDMNNNKQKQIEYLKKENSDLNKGKKTSNDQKIEALKNKTIDIPKKAPSKSLSNISNLLKTGVRNNNSPSIINKGIHKKEKSLVEAKEIQENEEDLRKNIQVCEKDLEKLHQMYKSLLNLSYNESEDLSTVRKDMTKIADEIDKKSDELYELKKRQQQYLRSKLIL